MFFDTWPPFFDMQKTLDEMDRILNAVGQPLGLRSVPRGTFPAINVYDQGDSALLLAEIPGLQAKDLELTILGDSVTLKGERREEAAEGERYYRKKRPVGSFLRTVTLPTEVDPDTVKAEYRDGVLMVRMNKVEKAKARKVEIKS